MQTGSRRVVLLKAFLFTMDSGERIVARVPARIAGPRRLSTNSEVATMAYGEILLHSWRPVLFPSDSELITQV